MRRWMGRLLKLVIFSAVVGALVYRVALAPVPVERHTIRPEGIVSEVLGTGTLEARTSAIISSKIPGRISEILADQGDRVTKGQLLVRLDDAELRQQVEIAQANLEAAMAAVTRAQADRQRASAVADQAQRQHARVQQLYARGSSSSEEIDRADEAIRVATAGLSESEAGLTQAARDRVAAEKTLDYHRARLGDTSVLAPFDGLIIRRDREPGDVVVPGGTILSLISTDELWISAWVDESRMSEVVQQAPARVVFRSEPSRSYPGVVARLGREADRETREYLVDITVKGLPQNWAIGQRAEVFLEAARKEGVPTLPLRYLAWRAGTPGTFVEKSGRAQWQPLRLGIRGEETIEVVAGLHPGGTAIRLEDTGKQLSPGQRVASP